MIIFYRIKLHFNMKISIFISLILLFKLIHIINYLKTYLHIIIKIIWKFFRDKILIGNKKWYDNDMNTDFRDFI